MAAWLLTLCIAAPSNAAFHLFRIDEVFSNADGSIQYVVLRESTGSNGENFWSGIKLETTSAAGVKQEFRFPSNLPSSATASRSVLVATSGFAALGLVAPDFIVPAGFVPAGGGRLDYANGTDQVTFGALPTDGATAIDRNGAPVAATPTNFANVTATVALTASPVNYEGLWWGSPAGSESGWGINFAHQGDVIFATWFTYDAAGKGWWLTMTANATSANVFSGGLFQTHGPPFSAVPFSPSAVTATQVGSGTLTFADAIRGTFAYTVNGIAQSKAITRQVFGPLPTCTFGATTDLAGATNYQDLWWAAPAGSESGWGVNFTHQGDTIFATWFTYDTDGTPLWLVVTAQRTMAGVYSGTLYRTTGPAFNAVPFNPAAVNATPVGNATLTFANGNAATFAYTVNGIAQSKAITRQVFRTPGTVCRSASATPIANPPMGSCYVGDYCPPPG
jgi:hypothetical protein